MDDDSEESFDEQALMESLAENLGDGVACNASRANSTSLRVQRLLLT